MSGRNARPVELLRQTGSSEVYRRKGEVPITPGAAEPPEWLSAAAREQWDRMVARLDRLGIASPGWRESLAQYCEAWSEWESLVVACRDEPHTVTSDKNVVRVNPLFTRKDQAFDRLLKLGREFGYSPASKTGVRVGNGETGDQSKDRFFKVTG